MTIALSTITPKSYSTTDLTNLSTDIRISQLALAQYRGSKLYMQDGVSDPFQDQTGVNTSLNTGIYSASYDATNKLYSPTILGEIIIPLSNSAQAISGGDNASFPKGNAFDGSTTTYWQSLQTTSHSGVSYIGQDFGVGNAYSVNQFILTTYSTVANNMPSVLVQYSDDGTTWTTVLTQPLLTAVTATTTYTIPGTYTAPGVGGHRYWRLLANANLASTGWYVAELQFVYTFIGSTASNSAQAISSGDSGANVKGNAFDGSTSTSWQSTQTGPSGISGVCYLGQDFGVGNSYAINQISFTSFSATTNNISSVLIQYSDNGTTWTTVQAFPLSTAASTISRALITGNPGAHRYWRLLANANIASGNWYVTEIAFRVATASIYQPYNLQSTSFTTTISSPSTARLCLQLPSYSTVSNPLNAISGGDYSGNIAYSAFSPSGVWGSIQATANQSGACYIGQDFGVGNAYTLTQITLTTYSVASNNMASVLVQYSDDGITWTTNQTATLSTTANIVDTITITGTPGAHRYWRLLANANLTTGYSWNVLNLAFYALPYVNFTPNTDLIAYVSRDGGTTFTSGTLTFVETLFDTSSMFDTGAISISGQPAGSTMVWKISNVNSKNISLTGVVIQWRP